MLVHASMAPVSLPCCFLSQAAVEMQAHVCAASLHAACGNWAEAAHAGDCALRTMEALEATLLTKRSRGLRRHSRSDGKKVVTFHEPCADSVEGKLRRTSYTGSTEDAAEVAKRCGKAPDHSVRIHTFVRATSVPGCPLM